MSCLAFSFLLRVGLASSRALAMKTVQALVLALVLASLCLAGCEKEESWTPGKPLPKDKVKIGVIHVDNATSGYSLSHDRGIQIMQKQLGLNDSQIIRKLNVNDADVLMVEHMMRECITKGANIIVATSWGHMDICEKLAPLFPNVIFANATGTKRNDHNFTNYFGRIYQARYLSGIVAGLRSKTGLIGFVAARGKDNSEVTGGVNAFALGVESVRPDARVLVRVTNSWFDPAGERHATQKLLEAGCDVITQHCNTTSPQYQAEKAGAWSIGYNSDMSGAAPGAVLTSVIWKWEAYYTRLVRSVMDGSFTTEPYIGSIKDGMVDITPLNPALTDRHMAEAVAEARARLENGACKVFDGVLTTNDGSTAGSEGGTLSDAEIFGNMHWYYHTVTELHKL